MRREADIAMRTNAAVLRSARTPRRAGRALFPTASRGGRTTYPSERRVARAFSLAELMIALVILGLGLLFIAAALPVGLEYTRQTIDMATADAAGDYAVRQLEMVLRTSRTIGDDTFIKSMSGISTFLPRIDNIHRPRDWNQLDAYPLNHKFRPSYEPIFKVRPLALGNISMKEFSGETHTRGAEIIDNSELTIAAYLQGTIAINQFRPFFSGAQPSSLRLEYDFFASEASPYGLLSFDRNPVVPGIARVYPPIEPILTNETDSGFSIQEFFSGLQTVSYHPYRSRPLNSSLDPEMMYHERRKATDQRFVWTAFYRRISYKSAVGPDRKWYNPTDTTYTNRSSDDVAVAPLVYEVIYILVQRPTVNHRFPRQDLTNPGVASFAQPRALNIATDAGGLDRLAPMPWLVTFKTGDPQSLPMLQAPAEYVAYQPNANAVNYWERMYQPTYNPPPTLEFICTANVGALLPPGSVFIPALNDQCYIPQNSLSEDSSSWSWAPIQQVGFVPSAPEGLPIYEVLERVYNPRRPGEVILIVKNPGYHPWVGNTIPPAFAAQYWPVWIIPPAFERRDLEGQPVYEAKSPIVKIIRRTITLPEIHR